ncbi:unnamed protein product [Heterobilharzia americana]|nr:unnamed protein product [Heterobilharzia americana]CAH8485231.1 unnamed protein product [Heterobilharzia americana]
MPTSTDLLSKSKREECWKSRDAYWECITKLCTEHEEPNDKLIKQRCGNQRKSYEASCPHTWISLFDKKKDFELFKAKKFDEKLKKSVGS